ncbi:DUF551 domain-containing protein [Acidovorax sp.]|jgi:hypothetical protein|uniref:DUF551 domain-containing protein n=1 Tax=Acidovorax sp. TaxID=1872122 RepID=UPI00262FCA56|nr:DUF551 domain-containing protein [Acidovorax sp.]HQS22749.1 DUF551 domain-containing protein [Acidovorax defluvii]HQS64831.1 DUF551 domain-containing protein [Acidovorax defluvii]HQT19612.1 DUF551 domain-containing protein [Acidovorax defluvii]HQT51823.1 DUF551 domain-containing protein [Acidovorax defluvii]
MNTTQPEALQLAECCEHGYPLSDEAIRAATELRRLHAYCQELESQLAQRFDAADVTTAAAQGFRDGVASAASWISVDARLPEPNTPVLLDIGKMFPLRALWAGKHTVSVGTDVDDWGEYDEKTDEYYCPEGWYEWNEHEEVHWAVSETPRAWRELPQPLPAATGPADGESK